ncbi:MAG: azurin [Flavobacteriaceae bacterium]|jgi:azurin|nr:azurin [Flavobacteriaceae bacterium]
MKNKAVKLSTLVVFALSLLISCGKSGGEDTKKIDPLAAAASTTPEDIQKAKEERLANLPENTLEIEGDDNMKYDLTELKVKAGKPITLTLKHVGKASITDMGHNWVVLKQGTDLEAFAQKAAKDVANNYIPNDPVIIAHTKLLGGGETDTIIFTIDEKGTYDYLCTFPAHNTTMRGKLIVE